MAAHDDLETLRRAFAERPSQAAGLPLARALIASHSPAEALAVAEQSLTYEKDFSTSELGPWNIEHALEDLVAQLKFPRETIGEHQWEWPGRDGMTFGARTYGTMIRWYVKYPPQANAKESGTIQTLWGFVAYGPDRSPLPPASVIRELAALLHAEDRPWFRERYAGST